MCDYCDPVKKLMRKRNDTDEGFDFEWCDVRSKQYRYRPTNKPLWALDLYHEGHTFLFVNQKGELCLGLAETSNGLWVYANDAPKFNFCPMCGRKFDD